MIIILAAVTIQIMILAAVTIQIMILTAVDYNYDRYDYVKLLSEEKVIRRLSDDWTIKSIIYYNEIQMQIDTGARCNVIS